MIKFNTWPPAAGEIEITSEALYLASISGEEPYKVYTDMGLFIGSVLLANLPGVRAGTNYGKAIDALAEQIPTEYRQHFTGGAAQRVSMEAVASAEMRSKV